MEGFWILQTLTEEQGEEGFGVGVFFVCLPICSSYCKPEYNLLPCSECSLRGAKITSIPPLAKVSPSVITWNQLGSTHRQDEVVADGARMKEELTNMEDSRF